MTRPRLQNLKRVSDAEELAGFGGGDAGVDGQAVEMVEAGGWRPGGQRLAAQLAEAFLESGDVGAGLRVARGNGAARARMAALEIHFADAEAHHAALVFAVELIFPERGQASIRARPGVVNVDFERGAEAPSGTVERHAGEPVADRLQRRSGNNRRAAGDGLVGETFGRVAHQDLLLEVDAKPFRSVLKAVREGKRARGNVAAIAGYRERDGAEIRRVGGANQMHRGGALAIDPTAVDRKERPSAVALEAAAQADARLGHRNRIERLDRMQA